MQHKVRIAYFLIKLLKIFFQRSMNKIVVILPLIFNLIIIIRTESLTSNQNADSSQHVISPICRFQLRKENDSLAFEACILNGQMEIIWEKCRIQCCPTSHVSQLTIGWMNSCQRQWSNSIRIESLTVAIIFLSTASFLLLIGYHLKKYLHSQIEHQRLNRSSPLSEQEKKAITASIYKQIWIFQPKQSAKVNQIGQIVINSTCLHCLKEGATILLDCKCSYHQKCFENNTNFNYKCIKCSNKSQFIKIYCRRCFQKYLLLDFHHYIKTSNKFDSMCQKCQEDDAISYRVFHTFSNDTKQEKKKQTK